MCPFVRICATACAPGLALDFGAAASCDGIISRVDGDEHRKHHNVGIRVDSLPRALLLLLQVPVEFRPGPTPWEKGGRRWVFLSLFNGVRAPHALSLAHMSPGPRDSAP